MTEKILDFTEADRSLLERVKRFLYQRGYPPHRALEIGVDRGVVVVQGKVPTFYLRQVAVACIQRVAGVKRVVDLIEVSDGAAQRQVADKAVHEQKTAEVSTRYRVEVPDVAGTAGDTFRFNSKSAIRR